MQMSMSTAPQERTQGTTYNGLGKIAMGEPEKLANLFASALSIRHRFLPRTLVA